MSTAVLRLAEAVAALLPFAILYFIVNHLQAFNQELGAIAKIGGVAIGDAIAPVIAGTLVVFAGIAGLSLLFYVGSKKLAGPEEHVPVPTLAPLAAPTPQFGANVGFEGRGVRFGGGSSTGRFSGRGRSRRASQWRARHEG